MSWEVLAVTISGLALMLNVIVIAFVIPMRRKVDQIDSLKKSIHDSAEKLIESKLSGLATHLEGVVNVVNERVSHLRDRLAKGDANFSDLDQRDRELESRFNVRFDQLKDYIHAHFASKQSVLDAHRRIDQIKNQTGGGHDD